MAAFNTKILLTELPTECNLPAPKWNIAVVGRAALECVSEAEQLPREGRVMRGTASMPEALLRARQLLPTFCGLAQFALACGEVIALRCCYMLAGIIN
jgi:hypothetical protein